jgi:Ca-activated chloride channel family protein
LRLRPGARRRHISPAFSYFSRRDEVTTMHLRRTILLSALLAAAVAFPALGNATIQSPQSDGDAILKIDSDLVTVDVTVTDMKGAPVAGMLKDDFILYEDGQPRRIEFFQANGVQGLRPVSLVFAMDFSGSVTPAEAALQRRSLEAFLANQHPDSSFALIAFNNDVKVLENFTKDPKKLVGKLEKFKDYGGSTRIFDAIDRGVTLLKKTPKYRNNRVLRRVIVTLTDGFDSSSNINIDELIRRANENEVTVYTVTVPSYTLTVVGRVRVPTPLDASRLVPLTGGRDFPITPGRDYTEYFKAISSDVATSYTLAYQPGETGGGRQDHKLSVVAKRPGVKLRLSRETYSRP